MRCNLNINLSPNCVSFYFFIIIIFYCNIIDYIILQCFYKDILLKQKSDNDEINTMDKLKNHLLDINKKEQTQYDEVIDFSRKMITKKYIDYTKDQTLNKNVNHLMSNIYSEKKIK